MLRLCNISGAQSRPSLRVHGVTMMDVSPYGAQQCGRTSQSTTPMSHKRMREDDITQILNDPPLKQKTSPSCMHSPHSPLRAADPMCHTPLGHLGGDCELPAVEMGVSWGVKQHLGPRK